MQSRMYELGWKILDWFFPPTCAGCGKWGYKYCPECLEKTKLISRPICQLCGIPLADQSVIICQSCRTSEVAFSGLRSWALFQDPLQSAIHQLKYRRDIGLAAELSSHLLKLLKRIAWPIDLITAIPLDTARWKERGYNQAALLAKPVAWAMGVRFNPGAVVKSKQTKPQVGLSRRERIDNVSGAFRAQEADVENKSILLVDDVITTGSTMNACSLALMQSGARSVYGISLARSIHISS